ncbi:MAG TPA: S9 family peptidase [Bacteroidales bacterium]|nr:S9 family peptidase [Bacteroidales bacterium]
MLYKILSLITIVLMVFASCSTPSGDKTKTGSQPDFSNKLTDNEIAGGKLTPEILWKFGRVGDVQVSPDGMSVVYSITRADVKSNKKLTSVFLIPVQGGEPKNLTEDFPSCYNPRWTPDGSKIGFITGKSGSSQIWEMKADGSAKTQVSKTDKDINAFEYAPSGGKLWYLADVKLDSTTQDIYPDLPEASGRIITDLMYRHWDSWSDYSYSHIFVADIKNGTFENGTDILGKEAFDSPLSPYFESTEIAWSPDGNYIAYTSKKLKGREATISTNSDIYLYSVKDSSVVNISEGNPGYDKTPVFSPDGKKIAYNSMATAGYESDKDRLMVYDIASKSRTDITENLDQSASNLVWSKDGSTIYFISGIKATFQVYSANVASKEIRKITDGWHDYTSLSLAGNELVGTKMSMSMASEIFRINPSSGAETQLTFTNKNIYDKIRMGKIVQKWVKTTDNKEMLVWVVLPPDFDSTKKYPALLYCQGGPQSAVSQFFSYRWNLQLMAANGYVVIAPNRRGLPTFGSEWNLQISGDYGGQNMRDYLSATDAIKKEPYVDENRLGAVGASYGGYSVFFLAGNHQKRFKAFIAHCGIFNLESQYGATEESFFTNFDLKGPYWQNPKPKSYDYSPHRFVQNWDTPIMIITGEKDFRIPYTESLQAFNAAQLRGIPSKLLIFPDENHWVVKPQNSILWQREFFGWLDKWLKK